MLQTLQTEAKKCHRISSSVQVLIRGGLHLAGGTPRYWRAFAWPCDKQWRPVEDAGFSEDSLDQAS